MTTDRLFVILLVMLIPMTGCFGAIGDAEADENDGNEIKMYSVGGDWNVSTLTEENNKYTVHTFTTRLNELVKVHYFDHNLETGVAELYTECGSGSQKYQATNSYDYLYHASSMCRHTVKLMTNGFSDWIGFSLVYSIHEVETLQPSVA